MEQNTITGEQISCYAERLTAERRSAGTVEKYRRDVRAFAVWLGARELTQESVAAWKDALMASGRAPSTVNAALSALSGFLRFSQRRAKDAVRDSVAAALAAEAPKLSLPAIENQLRAVENRQMELMQLALAAGLKDTSYDAELQKIYEAKAQLLMLKAEIELTEQDTADYDGRMAQVDEALEHDSGAISGYDDVMVRQLISNIKVLDKETLLVRFKDGTEIEQHIEKTKQGVKTA